MKDMWPVIHEELVKYVKDKTKSVPDLAACVPCSPDYLYKLGREDRGKRPGHRIVNGLGKCLDVNPVKVYTECMDNPEHVQDVLELEAGVPDILAGMARLVKERGAESPEVEKIRAELLFLLQKT